MKRAGGFTLLELLVALAIFAVIGAAAYSGLNTLLAVRATLERDHERLRQVQLALLWLRRDAEQLAPRPVRDAFGEPRPALIGDNRARDLLILTRTGRDNPLDLPRSGLERLGYRLRDDQLLRLSWPVLDRAEGSDAQSSLLLDEVRELSLRYLDRSGQWHERWPPPGTPDTALGRLPRALEVRLELSDWGELRRLFLLPEAELG
jgi:general secretion pathway protein J